MRFIIKKENPFETFETKEEADIELKKMRSHMIATLQKLNDHIDSCNKAIEEIDESGIPNFDWLLTYKEINYIDFIDYHIYKRRRALVNEVKLCEGIITMIDDINHLYGKEFIKFFKRVNTYLDLAKIN